MTGRKLKQNNYRVSPDLSGNLEIADEFQLSARHLLPSDRDEISYNSGPPIRKNDKPASSIVKNIYTEWELVETIQKSLTNIDDTLDSMLADAYEIFRPFIPKLTLEKVLISKKNSKTNKSFVIEDGEKVKDPELTSAQPDIVLMLSVLNDPKNVQYLQSSKVNLEAMAETSSLLVKILKQRVLALKAFKPEIKSLLQGISKKYWKSLSSAQDLCKDYDQFSDLTLEVSPYKRKMANVLFYCKKSNEYSIIYRSAVTDLTTEVKFFAIENQEKREYVLNEIFSEINESLAMVQLVAKGSLNRTYRIIQTNQGKDHRCMKMELIRIQELVKSPLSAFLLKSTTTTFLFSLMRILNKLNLLKNLLRRGIKHLMIVEHHFLKNIKKCQKITTKKSKTENLDDLPVAPMPESIRDKLVKYFDVNPLLPSDLLTSSPDAFPPFTIKFDDPIEGLQLH